MHFPRNNVVSDSIKIVLDEISSSNSNFIKESQYM